MAVLEVNAESVFLDRHESHYRFHTHIDSAQYPQVHDFYEFTLMAAGTMELIVDGETYFENESIFQEEFFQRLRNGACVSTSQPAPGALMDCWEGLLELCEDIIYLPMYIYPCPAAFPAAVQAPQCWHKNMMEEFTW